MGTVKKIKKSEDTFQFFQQARVWYGMVWYGMVEFNVPLDSV